MWPYVVVSMDSVKSEKLRLSGINKEILAFVGITLILTYVFDFWLILAFGSISDIPWYSTIVQMLIPAVVAIACLLFFKNRTITPSAKIFFSFFLLTAAVFLWEMFLGPIIPISLFKPPVYQHMPTLTIIVSVISALVLIGLNVVKKTREELYPSGLSFGKDFKWYAIIPILYTFLTFALFYLNHSFNYGDPWIEFSLEAFWATIAVNFVWQFFIGWAFFFGEEYGWRIYLQDRLFKVFGGVAGVLLLGVIWGVWHSGLIILGMNYPGQPVLGNIVMILYSVVTAIIFSFAVLKTGSVWIAVFLHLIVDAMEGPAYMYLSYPVEAIYTFGTGIYGIIIIGIVAVLLLRLDIWKQAAHLIARRQYTTDVQ